MSTKIPSRPKTRKSQRPNKNSGRVIGLPNFNRPNELYPPHLIKVMNYTQFFNLTASATAGVTGTSQSFSLNGLYDPDVTGVGHQPYGFDQICSSTGPYLRYKVIGVRAKITFINPAGTAPIRMSAVTAVFNPSNYSQAINAIDISLFGEKHNTRVDFIPSSGTQEKVVIIDFPSLHPILNLTKEQFMTEVASSTGDSAGNPAWPVYLKVAIADIATGSNTCGAKIDIAYKTQFYDRYMLPSS